MTLFNKFNTAPIFLSVENSSDLCSIALGNGFIISYREIKKHKMTSEYILYIINDLLNKTNTLLKDINFLILGIGPGNFTGIRLALSIVQGLALGNSIPIIEISSLSALALEIFYLYRKKQFLIMLDAKFDNVYYHLYNLTCNYLSFLSDMNIYSTININKISVENYKTFTVVNMPTSLVKILDKTMINIKKNVFPKALYLDILARKKILKKNFKPLIKLGFFYSIIDGYKKYKF